MSDLEALASGTASQAPRTTAADEAGGVQDAAAGRPAVAAEVSIDAPATYHRSGPMYARYISALARGALFLAKPSHMLTFMTAWVVLALREFLPRIWGYVPCCLISLGFFFTWVGVTGWYQAFRMNLVVWAADDNDDLPPVLGDGDWLDGMLIPLWRMVTTYVFASLPTVVFVLILWAQIESAVANSSNLAPGAPVPSPLSIIILVGMALAGLFVWPMLVLIVACGGSVGAMFRLDLIGETILNSFPAYLFTALAVYVAFGVKIIMLGIVVSGFGLATNWRADWFTLIGLPAFLVGVALYFDVLAMRAIGFYYRCFKEKFAWSWG